MSFSPLQICLDQHHRQAVLSYRLDDELGILHGLSWADFVLLNALDTAGGVLPTEKLAQILSISRSRLLLQLLPLEKIGLVARSPGEGGIKCVSLQSSGQRQTHEARETAARLCKEFLGVYKS